MKHITSLSPLLVVRDAAQAIDFYRRALGAELLAGEEDAAALRIRRADLALGGARLSLIDDRCAPCSDAPGALASSRVLLQLDVEDAAARVRASCAAGAVAVEPLRLVGGELTARLRDPLGHLWLVRQQLEPGAPSASRRRDGRHTRFGALTTAATKDPVTISEGAPALQAAAATGERSSPRIHLVTGPVGAGKSTFALQLARERSSMRLTLDDWMATLFRPDRPETGLIAWYRERAERCIDQIWRVALQLCALGSAAVLELGLLQREERERFYARVAAAGLPLTVHVLDAARDVRRARVLERNLQRGPTFSTVVPPDIFELASDLWQAPDSDECQGRDVRFLRTDAGE